MIMMLMMMMMGVEDDSQEMNYKSGAFAQWETVGAFGAKSLFKAKRRQLKVNIMRYLGYHYHETMNHSKTQKLEF